MPLAIGMYIYDDIGCVGMYIYDDIGCAYVQAHVFHEARLLVSPLSVSPNAHS